uniref:Uncharacterized protein n=1 Tax=Anguilla anguilla TaxID=7936 RepID=A0A0E9TYB5_ANGAN
MLRKRFIILALGTVVY